MSAGQPYHRIPVAEVIRETPDAVSLVLAVPPELAGAFTYRPGQFLTVRVPHPGTGSVARCYSLSSSPYTGPDLKITVKRMGDGHASNWICERVTPGTVLEVAPPAGRFVPASLDIDLLLLAGGSGITPVLSILTSVLAQGRGHVALLYANRDEPSVIFAAELRRLRERHPDRLCVVHWLDRVQGPPTVAGLTPLLRPYLTRDAFVCGPPPFLAVAAQTLDRLGLPPQRLHVERFEFDGDPVPDAAAEAAGPAGVLEVTLVGQTHRLAWPPGTR
ncbi:MAG TPA: FAD-binding oxidoreductase, partial [Catenuloplanes sp.]